MSRHDNTRAAIDATPTRRNIRWSDAASLLRHLGADVNEGAEGSRVTVTLNGRRAFLHKPHPRPEMKAYQVEAIRDFLIQAGV